MQAARGMRQFPLGYFAALTKISHVHMRRSQTQLASYTYASMHIIISIIIIARLLCLFFATKIRENKKALLSVATGEAYCWIIACLPTCSGKLLLMLMPCVATEHTIIK